MRDPSVTYHMDEETKEHIVSGTGELHLEVCASALRDLLPGVPLVTSPAKVSYRETVQEASATPCLAKTTNKHNRFWLVARPLPDKVVDDIKEGRVPVDSKPRFMYLRDECGLEKMTSRRVWACGGAEFGENCLIDATEGVQNTSDVRDMVLAAFREVCASGPLCGERVRGVEMRLVDAKLHSEPAQRRAGQVVPAVRRAMAAAILSASPALLQPLSRVTVRAPREELGHVHGALSNHRAVLELDGDAEDDGAAVDVSVHASLPVLEAGRRFAETLRKATSGRALYSTVFGGWQALSDDRKEVLCGEIRTSKNMAWKDVDELVDRL